MERSRIVLVLSGGGLRCRAALGVLRRLHDEAVPIHGIIGVSGGALIAAYYVGIGWSVEECIAEVGQLDSKMLMGYGAARSRWRPLSSLGRRLAGRVPEWLSLLDAASFDRPHHGVEAVGILAYDVARREPVFFATGRDNDGVEMGWAARGSAAVPGVLGPIEVRGRSRTFRLVDGGVGDPLPVHRAFEPPFEATVAVAVDLARDPRAILRRRQLAARYGGGRIVWLRPRVGIYGTLLSRRGAMGRLVEAGERSIAPAALERIRHG